MPQVALNWLLQRPSVATVIIGARNEEQLRENLGAVGWTLTPEQVARLDAASAMTPAYPYWHQAVSRIATHHRCDETNTPDILSSSRDHMKRSSSRHKLPIVDGHLDLAENVTLFGRDPHDQCGGNQNARKTHEPASDSLP